jgi:hypothetical protein
MKSILCPSVKKPVVRRTQAEPLRSESLTNNKTSPIKMFLEYFTATEPGSLFHAEGMIIQKNTGMLQNADLLQLRTRISQTALDFSNISLLLAILQVKWDRRMKN